MSVSLASVHAILVEWQNKSQQLETKIWSHGMASILRGVVVGCNHEAFVIETFEHQRIRDPQLREFWCRSKQVAPAPEEWMLLDEEQKNQLREVIRDLRALGEARNTGRSGH